jgi:hypothetical protein
VLCLSTTWLRALLHSPARAIAALPGFFVRGRMGRMLRFTIKAILYGTAIIASYCAVGKLGPTLAGMVMFLVYFGLIFYAAFSPQDNSPSSH